MAFNTLSAQAVCHIRNNIIENNQHPSVIELGNQRLKIPVKNLNKILDQFKISINNITSTKEFYLKLGFSKYIAIDVNTEKDAVAFDLNLNLIKNYGYKEQFDLVTNNGTGEHIFNQMSVFENIHNLCKVSGFIINILPFTGYIDHGFYNFQPNLFLELARMNNYELKELWIGDSSGKIEKINNSYKTYYKNNNFLEKFNLNNWNQHLLIISIMKKMNDDDFKLPFQQIYINDIQEASIKERYEKNQ